MEQDPSIPVAEQAASIHSGKVLVCVPVQNGFSALYLQAKKTDCAEASELLTIESPEQALSLRKRIGSNCVAVLVLPRPHYLVKSLQIAGISDQELQGAIDLECELLTPAGFGEAETSYRKLSTDGQGHHEFEVTIAKQDVISAWIEQAEAFGLSFDRVLPGTLLIERALRSSGDVRLLAYVSANEKVEVAAVVGSKTLVRDVGSCDKPAECLVSIGEVARQVFASGGEPVVGWLGGVPSWAEAEPYFSLTHQGIEPGPAVAFETDDTAGWTARSLRHMLTEVGLSCLAMQDAPDLRTADLMPQVKRDRRQGRLALRSAVVGTSCLLATSVLTAGALWLSANRYEQRCAELIEQKSLISATGAKVRQQMDELEAMQSAWSRRNLFKDVIAALYEVTPEGVVYHQVDLREDGSCALRGQAPSVALPFELPEKMDRQSIFTDVLLVDVGQVRKGAGTVAEFRIDCRVSAAEKSP